VLEINHKRSVSNLDKDTSMDLQAVMQMPQTTKGNKKLPHNADLFGADNKKKMSRNASNGMKEYSEPHKGPFGE